MSQFSVARVSISYGGQAVLKDVSLQLQPGEKAGLIGPNGSGKTTLLKIIAGELEADQGSVHHARGMVVAYLPQDLVLSDDGTLRDYLKQPLHELFCLKEEVADLERRMSAGPKEPQPEKLEALLVKYGQATARFEALGGYSAENRISAVAQGLGFKSEDLDRELQRFSGGEKTRARLAALLLQQPDLLLLDEPTNFLDLEGIEWLERFLRESTRALIVVSHDRFFLDRVAGRIFSLKDGTVKCYGGNYSAYLAQREQEQEAAERAYRRQQALLEREERLIRESKIDERSKRQARSRRKQLDKLEILERPAKVKTFTLGLEYSGRSGKQVIAFDGVSKSFGSRVLFRDLSFEIYWGDRIALIGPNGAGKSTLLKLIASEEDPDSGTILLGASVNVTYFSQEQEQLLPEHTLLEEISAVSNLDLKQARNHLGAYLFRGDDVFKKVKNLSGGEKCRLALARLALGGGNCLLMDEPTSHLDLPAVEELEKALQRYPGTLIVVSHDRYFLQNLVNRVMELGCSGFYLYDGNFREFLEQRAGPEERPVSGAREHDAREAQKQSRIEEHRRRQEIKRRQRRLLDEQARLEENIAAAEAAIARLEKLLDRPEYYGDYNRIMELNSELEAEKESMSAFLKRWEETALELENFSAEDL